jgi:hypothetical protein
MSDPITLAARLARCETLPEDHSLETEDLFRDAANSLRRLFDEREQLRRELEVRTTAHTNEPITERRLRDAGFKWECLDQWNSKHWILWMGGAVSEETAFSSEDLGVEVAYAGSERDWWFCWVRADYCGRYSRFIHVRRIRQWRELAELIGSLTGFPFDPANVMYGCYHRPEVADRYRQDYSRRPEVRIAEEWGRRAMQQTGQDPDGRDKVRP